jgi:hypothetical protein
MLVVMFSTDGMYVEACREALRPLLPGIRAINCVAYDDGRVTWVHAIHPAAQGNHLPNWLEAVHGRPAQNREAAIDAVRQKAGLLRRLARESNRTGAPLPVSPRDAPIVRR